MIETLRNFAKQALGGAVFYATAQAFFTSPDDSPEGRALALAPVLVPVTIVRLIFWMEGYR